MSFAFFVIIVPIRISTGAVASGGMAPNRGAKRVVVKKGEEIQHATTHVRPP